MSATVIFSEPSKAWGSGEGTILDAPCGIMIKHITHPQGYCLGLDFRTPLKNKNKWMDPSQKAEDVLHFWKGVKHEFWSKLRSFARQNCGRWHGNDSIGTFTKSYRDGACNLISPELGGSRSSDAHLGTKQ